ncbi:MAG: outer membrane protein assembly factor BamA [Treponema sp.]|nr:outer membrane protein assembly factor BamA [Treponema sp.]
MRRRLLSILFFSMLAVFSLSAQEEDSDWFWNKNISKIEFSGLKNVKKSELVGVVSSFIGEPFNEEVYSEIVDRLYALDLFDDIEPYAEHDKRNKDNVIVKFQVSEKPQISEISFVGNMDIRNGELREKIKSKVSDVYVETKILMDERIIRDYYIEKGYTGAKVSHNVDKTEKGMAVTFNISEGNNTVIKEIHFQGNSIISERSLKGKLKLKEIGFMRNGAYQVATLEYDKRVIINYYQENGYIDANILEVKIDRQINAEKRREELIITYIIQEGSQYTYSGISFEGNKIFGTEELMALQKLQPGKIFNLVKFQEGLIGVQTLYVENGYMSTQINPIAEKDVDKKEISYKVQIFESTRSHIENIIVKGNQKTKDYVIKREIPIKPGDVFSREKIINGMRNLYNLRYFSNIVPDIQAGSEQDLVDLVFAVEEQSTTTLNAGMTFSGITSPDDFPVSIYANFDNLNLFGEGRAASIKFTLAKNEQTIDLGYSQNWFGDLPISFSQSLSFSHKTTQAQVNHFDPDLGLDQYYNYSQYEGYSFGLGSSAGKRWFPNFAIVTTTGGLSSSLTRYNYDESLYVPTDLGVSLFANRWGILNSLWFNVSLDNRDMAYDPTKGWFASQRLSWYGLIPGLEKEFFIKSDTKLEGYLTLFNWPINEKYTLKAVLAGYTGFTGLIPVGDSTISESNKIYVDGMFNGRGWVELYRNSAAKGQAMWSTNLEIRVPIVPNILGVDIFHDMVVIKPTIQDMFTSIKPEDFYFSFGPGLRLLIPQLPLHFMFTFRYHYDNGSLKMADNPYQFVLSFNMTNK